MNWIKCRVANVSHLEGLIEKSMKTFVEKTLQLSFSRNDFLMKIGFYLLLQKLKEILFDLLHLIGKGVKEKWFFATLEL